MSNQLFEAVPVSELKPKTDVQYFYIGTAFWDEKQGFLFATPDLSAILRPVSPLPTKDVEQAAEACLAMHRADDKEFGIQCFKWGANWQSSQPSSTAEVKMLPVSIEKIIKTLEEAYEAIDVDKKSTRETWIQTAIKRAIAALQSTPTEPEHTGWVRVEDGLPECHVMEGKKKKINWVLGANGKTQSVVVYTKGHELEYGDDDPSDDEYDEIEERNGCMYLKPGWYELEDTPGSNYDETWVKRDITHWRPLPSFPGAQTSKPYSIEEEIKRHSGKNRVCKRCEKRDATKDYNGHGYYVCDPCYELLSNEFDEEYR